MPLIPGRRRRAWDEQPTDPAATMLAADGRRRFSERAIAEAVALSPSGPVAVVTIAKIHGTQFGLPNPGLMPTRQELADRQQWIGSAVDAITTAGGTADGQVAVTRKVVKTLARIARTRGVRTIVIDETPYTGLRRFVEGDVGEDLRRKLRDDGVEVIVVPALPNP